MGRRSVNLLPLAQRTKTITGHVYFLFHGCPERTPLYFPGLFAGHDPTRESGHVVFKMSRVGSCREVFKISRVGSGQVGSRVFQMSRVGSGQIGSGQEVMESSRVGSGQVMTREKRVTHGSGQHDPRVVFY